MAIFEYTVKYNGIRYPAGVEVPMEEVKTEAPVVEKATEVAEVKVSSTETASPKETEKVSDKKNNFAKGKKKSKA